MGCRKWWAMNGEDELYKAEEEGEDCAGDEEGRLRQVVLVRR